MPARRNTKSEHYVDNKEFLKHMIAFREKTLEAREAGLGDPTVPNEIGEVFVRIANHLSFKSNFINYGFRDDMIADGIENCIQYVHNFDPEKSRNPFAYFTQIIYYAFLRRIQKEKKQLYVRYKSLENSQIASTLMNSPEYSKNDHAGAASIGFAKLYDNMSEFIDTYETSMEKKKQIKKSATGTKKKKARRKKKTESGNSSLQFVTNLDEG